MEPGRGQQTSLWGGSLKDSNLTPPSWGQRSTPPSWFTDEALYWVNRGEETPVWISLPLPKLRKLGAQPCQPGGGIKVTHHPQPRGGRIWGMDQQPHKAAVRGPQQRETLSGQKEASQLFYSLVNKTPAKDKLTSSVTLIWLCLLRCFAWFGHARFLPQTGNGRSNWWLSKRQRAPFFCLIPRRSSLLPLSFLPPLWLSHHPSPSIAGFLLSQPFGRWVWTGQRRWRVEERTGVKDWKRNRLGMDLRRICPSINLTSFSKTLLFLSAWSPIGFAATRSLYWPRPLCI